MRSSIHVCSITVVDPTEAEDIAHIFGGQRYLFARATGLKFPPSCIYPVTKTRHSQIE